MTIHEKDVSEEINLKRHRLVILSDASNTLSQIEFSDQVENYQFSKLGSLLDNFKATIPRDSEAFRLLENNDKELVLKLDVSWGKQEANILETRRRGRGWFDCKIDGIDRDEKLRRQYIRIRHDYYWETALNFDLINKE